jgi:ribosomal protein L11 methyltransferase
LQKDLWDDTILEDILFWNLEFKIDYTFAEIDLSIERRMGKNFEPIDVEGNCHVRALLSTKTDAELTFLLSQK